MKCREFEVLHLGTDISEIIQVMVKVDMDRQAVDIGDDKDIIGLITMREEAGDMVMGRVPIEGKAITKDPATIVCSGYHPETDGDIFQIFTW